MCMPNEIYVQSWHKERARRVGHQVQKSEHVSLVNVTGGFYLTHGISPHNGLERPDLLWRQKIRAESIPVRSSCL